MKKNVLVFGLISGLIVSAVLAISIGSYNNAGHYEYGMLIGYASMIVAFAFIFVGIRNYRDKYSNGLISFGQAFKMGFWIALIASTFYVITWLICFYGFVPDYMDKYAEQYLSQMKQSGASQADIDKTLAEMSKYKEMYKSPVFVVLLTYMEILPLGIVISLISALILKRKSAGAEAGMA